MRPGQRERGERENRDRERREREAREVLPFDSATLPWQQQISELDLITTCESNKEEIDDDDDDGQAWGLVGAARLHLLVGECKQPVDTAKARFWPWLEPFLGKSQHISILSCSPITG